MEGKKRRILIVADAGTSTGFAQVTHNLIKQLYHEWDIHVLAINYFGDPHPIQQFAKLYNPQAKVVGDNYGYSRIIELQRTLKPDVVFYINDPWVLMQYLQAMGKPPTIPHVFYTPVDGKNLKKPFITPLNDFSHGVAYTEFGAEALKLGGFTKPLSVIPHGVDTEIFHPVDRLEARAKSGGDISDWYIVQVVDRNTPRKRIDLAIYGFARWVHETNKPDTVKFYYHGALKDEGYDLLQLADYYGVGDRMMVTGLNLDMSKGIDLKDMKYIYSLADVKVSMSGGEGWGLTTMESMACGVPNIVLDAAALGEWPRGGVEYVEPSDIPTTNIFGLNTIHAQPKIESYVAALEKLYTDKAYRLSLGQAGREIVTQDKFKWSTIAKQFDIVFTEAIDHGKSDSNGEGVSTFTW